MDEIKVSVIIPVYNGEKYLSQAIDSVLAQTMKAIEIILVDDGSEDGTKDIIKLYKEKYPDIIVDIYNKENCSSGSARNIGVSHARGEYIGFLDADDRIDSDFYEKMYGRAKEKDADIVRCGLMRVNDKGETWIHSLPKECWDAELDDGNKRRIVVSHFWGLPVCIFRRRTWLESGFRIIEHTSYDEDMSTVLLVLCSTRMAIVREPIYKYWVNPEGNGAPNESIYKKSLDAAEKILLEAKRLGVFECYREELNFFVIVSTMFSLSFNSKNYQSFPCEQLYFISQRLEEIVPSYINNKYLRERADARSMAIMRVGQIGVAQTDYFLKHEDEIMESNTQTLLDQYKNCRVAIWGAAQRGQNFLKKYDEDRKKICRVIDKDKALHGTKMPTGHPVSSYEECKGEVDVIFIMNHKYYEEILSDVAESQGIEFVDYEEEAYRFDGNQWSSELA